MLPLSLLIPPLIISLPQALFKLSYISSTFSPKSIIEYSPPDLRETPALDTGPIVGYQREKRAPYIPLLISGRDAWRVLEMDSRFLYQNHVWFVWFSSIKLKLGPLERGEWPLIFEDEGEEFEWRRRRMEVGMFQGSKNDEFYRVRG